LRIETTATETDYHHHITWQGKSYDMPVPMIARSSLYNHKTQHAIYTTSNEIRKENKKPTLVARIQASSKHESWPIILENKRLIDLMLEFNFKINESENKKNSGTQKSTLCKKLQIQYRRQWTFSC